MASVLDPLQQAITSRPWSPPPFALFVSWAVVGERPSLLLAALIHGLGRPFAVGV